VIMMISPVRSMSPQFVALLWSGLLSWPGPIASVASSPILAADRAKADHPMPRKQRRDLQPVPLPVQGA
jgi:hypothetical protein